MDVLLFVLHNFLKGREVSVVPCSYQRTCLTRFKLHYPRGTMLKEEMKGMGEAVVNAA